MQQGLVIDDHPIVREGLKDLLKKAVPLYRSRPRQAQKEFSRRCAAATGRLSSWTSIFLEFTASTRLLQKLGLRNLVDLVRYAVDEHVAD